MRKLTTSVLLLVTLISAVKATDSDTAKSTAKSRLELGVSFAPSVAYSTLRATDRNPDDIRYVAYERQSERPIYGHDVRFNVVYHFHDHFAFQTGLGYAIKGIQYIQTDPQVWSGGTYYVRRSNVLDYHYFTLPAMLRINAGKKRVKFSGSVGVEAEALWAEMFTSIIVDQHNGGSASKHFDIPAHPYYRVFSMSAMASAGVEWKITERLGTRIAPFFSHQFLPLSSRIVNTYLWTAGVDFSFFFGVK